MQEKIAGALPLDVSLEHLSNYIMVWDLQPIIQSDFVALLPKIRASKNKTNG